MSKKEKSSIKTISQCFVLGNSRFVELAEKEIYDISLNLFTFAFEKGKRFGNFENAVNMFDEWIEEFYKEEYL